KEKVEEVIETRREEPYPEPKVLIRVGYQNIEIENSALAETIFRAWNLKREIESIEPSYEELRNQIITIARDFTKDHGTVSFTITVPPIGRIEVKVTFQYEAIIDPENINEVKRILGDRYPALVKAKYKYVGTKRLIELMASNDPIVAALAPYVAVKEFGRSVQFRVK
ncbi:MAG: hypothetical protein ABIM21_01885, partial [candidate division WOR-3 bacterium]